MKRSEKYVVLEHLTLPDRGLRFWSTNSDNNTHGHTGELWYKEILFTNSEEEAIDVSRHHSELPTHQELEDFYKKRYEEENK
jgi:hypothetical protein